MKRVNVYPQKRNAVDREYVKKLLDGEAKANNNTGKETAEESL